MDDETRTASDAQEGPATEAGETPRPRLTRNPSPWRMLEAIDRQWKAPALFRGPDRTIVSLALTTPEDPRAFDYLGAVAGASEADVADACKAWLHAQLAADAIRLGRVIRPTVELVPAGGLWHVVRTLGSRLLLIDGPGWPTPFAAATAASRRYRAELRREMERSGDAWAEDDDGALDELDTDDPDRGEPDGPKTTRA